MRYSSELKNRRSTTTLSHLALLKPTNWLQRSKNVKKLMDLDLLYASLYQEGVPSFTSFTKSRKQPQDQETKLNIMERRLWFWDEEMDAEEDDLEWELRCLYMKETLRISYLSYSYAHGMAIFMPCDDISKRSDSFYLTPCCGHPCPMLWQRVFSKKHIFWFLKSWRNFFGKWVLQYSY